MKLTKKYQQISNEAVIIAVKEGKTCNQGQWKGLPLNSYSEVELEAVDLRRYVEPVAPGPVHSVQEQIAALDNAIRMHIDAKAHWSAAPMIYEKAKGSKPLSKALNDWVESCWNDFEIKVGQLMTGTPFDETMLIFPAPPDVSVLDARKE